MQFYFLEALALLDTSQENRKIPPFHLEDQRNFLKVMVNRLITISIKVNMLLCRRESHVEKQGFDMNKRPNTKGFWGWLLGSGWGGGGSGG